MPVKNDACGNDREMIKKRKTAVYSAREMHEDRDQKNIAGSLQVGVKTQVRDLTEQVPVDDGQRINGEEKIVEIRRLKGIDLVLLLKENERSDQKARKKHPAPYKQFYADRIFFS